jgi:hypothetical protein
MVRFLHFLAHDGKQQQFNPKSGQNNSHEYLNLIRSPQQVPSVPSLAARGIMIKLPKTCLPLQWKYWSYLPFDKEYTSYFSEMDSDKSQRLRVEMCTKKGRAISDPAFW